MLRYWFARKIYCTKSAVEFNPRDIWNKESFISFQKRNNQVKTKDFQNWKKDYKREWSNVKMDKKAKKVWSFCFEAKLCDANWNESFSSTGITDTVTIGLYVSGCIVPRILTGRKKIKTTDIMINSCINISVRSVFCSMLSLNFFSQRSILPPKYFGFVLSFYR